jgi:hypothetical protein
MSHSSPRTQRQAAGGQHGFTRAAGVFSDITGPGGAAFLSVDLNNMGQLIGTFGGTGQPARVRPAGFGVAALSRFASEGWWAQQDSNLRPAD